MLRIENDGPRILATNFWELPDAALGRIMVSVNGGAFRILLPPASEVHLGEMATARECVVSRGPWPVVDRADAFEVLFDDGSACPFALFLTDDAFADVLPADDDRGRPLRLSVWTRPRRGKPHLALERPCWYRRVPHIPCLRPREDA